jgi:hypothetical protein
MSLSCMLPCFRCLLPAVVCLFSVTALFGQAETQNPNSSAAGLFWKIAGNTNTNIANHFVGTTDAVDLALRTNSVERMRILSGGNVGIGTVLPAVRMDVNGDFAMREGAAIALVNGVNGTIVPGATSHLRISGPTGAFSIAGLTGGVNGKVITIINTTAQPFTILNNAAATAANGIFTNSGSALTLAGIYGSVTLIYNSTLARWLVKSTTGEIEANEWHITGNAGIITPALPVTYGTSPLAANSNWIGTTDANDFVIGTNNIERLRVKQTSGYVGIGTANPTHLFTINHGGTTETNMFTYPWAIQQNNTTELAAGINSVGALIQTWNAKPLLINGQGSFFVAINKTTAPIQNLDINGRMNVANGVIQRGTTQITATNDLGLYSQVASNWIRVAANAAPIKFFTDQGGANSAGTNATMSVDNQNGGGVMIAAETGGTGNAGAPYQRAALEISSTTKGFLMPRMTTSERDAMGNSLTEGLMIYNTSTDCFEWWDTKATPSGGNGFWNSLCDNCENIVIVSTNQTGFNLNTYVGGGKAENYCVYINSGVVLTPSGNGGGNGVAGNPGFNSSSMPTGAKVTLYNYGTIYGGGGNGGLGGREVDAVCSGSDATGGAGGAGGHAILTSAGVSVTVFNYGTIRAGGGGGGGGGWGCCAAGGGGGGGAGTPAGNGGGGTTTNCVSGTICGCNSSTSGGGAAGTALAGGAGGAGVNRPATSCPTCNGVGAGSGGSGGGPGLAGNAGTSGNAGGGGAAGLALQGNGSGSSIANFGTQTGTVNP